MMVCGMGLEEQIERLESELNAERKRVLILTIALKSMVNACRDNGLQVTAKYLDDLMVEALR
jgi:hypothetical protein